MPMPMLPMFMFPITPITGIPPLPIIVIPRGRCGAPRPSPPLLIEDNSDKGGGRGSGTPCPPDPPRCSAACLPFTVICGDRPERVAMDGGVAADPGRLSGSCQLPPLRKSGGVGRGRDSASAVAAAFLAAAWARSACEATISPSDSSPSSEDSLSFSVSFSIFTSFAFSCLRELLEEARREGRSVPAAVGR